nr:hypothetical protein [Micromonospora olivasterospora]
MRITVPSPGRAAEGRLPITSRRAESRSPARTGASQRSSSRPGEASAAARDSTWSTYARMNRLTV